MTGAATALDIASGRELGNAVAHLAWMASLPGALDIARDRLGPQAYEVAWEEGLGMTADEAVAYALS